MRFAAALVLLSGAAVAQETAPPWLRAVVAAEQVALALAELCSAYEVQPLAVMAARERARLRMEAEGVEPARLRRLLTTDLLGPMADAATRAGYSARSRIDWCRVAASEMALRTPAGRQLRRLPAMP